MSDQHFAFEYFPDFAPWIKGAVLWVVNGWPHFYEIVKHVTGWLVGLSFPVSVAFLIMIIYVVERLKQIRKMEEEKFDKPIEQAYAEVDSEADPGLAARWVTVQKHIESENPNDWKQAIMEADIMLDDLLSNMGYRGESIGEKLKRVDHAHMTTLNDAWEAHKVRNQIAHEGSTFSLTKMDAERVIKQYKKVFEEFYFIQ